MINFNRNLDDENFHSKHMLLPSWFPFSTPIHDFMNFGKMARHFLFTGHSKKEFVINTEIDRDTFKGFSYQI